VAAAYQPAFAGARAVQLTGEDAGSTSRSCMDPIFPWLGKSLTKPSVVLAPDLENTCIPAYSAAANVVSLRGGSILAVLPQLEKRTGGRVGVPQGVSDVRSFFHHPTNKEIVSILRRHHVDYVMVHRTSRLNLRLAGLPFLLAFNNPGQAYAFYAVDHAKLDAYGG
jgi:hypothetical protein